MRLALVCGELSGDALGAGLARELRAENPDAELAGVTGPRMRAAGVRSWMDCGVFAVMGYWDALRRMPALLAGRRRLLGKVRQQRPDVYVGIDAPDLNLGVGGAARAHGARYVQLGCPAFWGWRPQRAEVLARHCDLVLCVLPFEERLCAEKGISASFVGHRAADVLRPAADRAAVKRGLGLDSAVPLLALLPGSRRAEIARHATLFAQAVSEFGGGLRTVQIVCAPPDDPEAASVCRAAFASCEAAGVRVMPGRAHEVLAAADAALVKSGTATLEAAVLDCPLAAVYVMSGPAAWLVRRKMGDAVPRHIALPNVILNRAVVPEFVQEGATPQRLAEAVGRLLDGRHAAQMRGSFGALRKSLRRDADRLAARHVLRLATG